MIKCVIKQLKDETQNGRKRKVWLEFRNQTINEQQFDRIIKILNKWE